MTYQILWIVHAILMGVAFLSLTTGFVLFRVSKRNFRYHKALGLGGSVTGYVALILAVVMVQIGGGFHLSSVHALTGAAAGLGLITVPLLGLKRKRLPHRMGGYITLLLMGAAILLGLTMMGIL